MKKIIFILIIFFNVVNCYATDPIKIFESESERMYFYPDYSYSFNYGDGRSGYTVHVRRIWTVPKNGAKSADLVLEFNSSWTQVRVMKWFENDINNNLLRWETTNPRPWQKVREGTVGGNIRNGVRRYF